MDNVTLTPEESEINIEVKEVLPTETNNKEPVQIDLTTIEIKDDITALSVMVGYLTVAQKRGVFSFNESAKIWECIQKFIVPPSN